MGVGGWEGAVLSNTYGHAQPHHAECMHIGMASVLWHTISYYCNIVRWGLYRIAGWGLYRIYLKPTNSTVPW